MTTTAGSPVTRAHHLRAPGGAAIVVPIRAFALGKARLAGHLSDDARAELARRCADAVVDAAADTTVVVVSSDPDVRTWASARSLAVIDDPGTLDAAATAGRAWVAAHGGDRAVVAHADLPRARSFVALTRDGAREIVTLVPCHRDDGTPVLSVPVALDFRFAYGPGSFRRHAAEARRLGAGLRVVRDPDLGFDVDLPDDVDALRASRPDG
jgi:2-phospho-L-lactate/phosphoenolpyruvate guanylyltransferase